ncbi:helix-turn-helix transcriptional regulator [Streptomyces sp. NPDC059534]|uniref:helix-turn-helix transcriptional regulator n=1 Tax=Streptomyces sp. NPDC059534 TaxID=3346859 RepID=UPI0036B82A1E
MSMSRPLLTQREAASACGVSRSTIRRRREAGDLPGCVQDEARGWLIPVEALLAAGFRVNAPAPPEGGALGGPKLPAEGSTAAGEGDDVAQTGRVREQAHALELAEARHAAALAQAEARFLREQLAAKEDHIEDLRSALRALSPAPERTAIEPAVPGQGHTESSASATQEAEGESRRRWRGGRR